MSLQRGDILVSAYYRTTFNTPHKTQLIALPASTRRLFVCVNSDHYSTNATGTQSVTALVQSCF
jgi:hypothetical protein